MPNLPADDPVIELRLLGTTGLRVGGDEARGILSAPKRLGLVAYLALARPRGYQRRDVLLPLFWPKLGQAAARNALSNLLYHIRRVLGEGVLVNRGAEEIGIRREGLWTDAVAFEETLERGDARNALELYRGDLLEGFHLPGAAPAFGQWLDRERERLRSLAAEGSWDLAERAEEEGRGPEARKWARSAADLTPFSEKAHARLIAVLDRLGDPVAALDAYEALATRLREEWELDPSGSLQELAEGIRIRARRSGGGSLGSNVAQPSDRSIAVLPFETLTSEPASSFTEGIHGDLLTRLSNVSDLRAISRTSVRRYRNTHKTLRQVGRELGARWILEGEVQQAGDRFQMNTRLVHVRDDRQVWARDFRGTLTAENLFQVQSEIAKGIVRGLEAKLTPEEQERVEQRPTENLDAYRLYVQGRGHLDERTEEGFLQALGYFREAIEHDDRYALAWAGLTDSLSLLEFYGYAPPEDAPDPLKTAHRAVELGPDLGEARAALGIAHSSRLEGPEALRELRRAVELKSSYAEAQIWLAWLLVCTGEPAEALGLARQAVALSPLAPAMRVYMAEILLANGREGEALREARRAREIQPQYGLAHFMEGLVLYHQGRLSDAKAALNEALPLTPVRGTPTHAEIRAVLALAHAASGEHDRARHVLTGLADASAPCSEGLIHAALGDVDAALDAFDRVRDWSTFSTEFVRYFFPEALASLRDDPRFGRLLSELDRSWGMPANT